MGTVVKSSTLEKTLNTQPFTKVTRAKALNFYSDVQVHQLVVVDAMCDLFLDTNTRPKTALKISV